MNDPREEITRKGNYFKDNNLEIIPIICGKGQDIRASYLRKTLPIKGKVMKDKLQEFGLQGKDIGIIMKKGKIEKGGELFTLMTSRNRACPP